MSNPKDPSFSLETAINRIKEIQVSLQDNQLTFERALQLFEEADGLIKQCQQYLQQAELRLRVLGEGGEN